MKIFVTHSTDYFYDSPVLLEPHVGSRMVASIQMLVEDVG